MLSANSDVLLHLVVSGLFSGFGWLAFGRVFGIGARFGVYEILTAYCKGKVFFFFKKKKQSSYSFFVVFNFFLPK
jgi:hypothetical protein